jgi:hypothetical protein
VTWLSSARRATRRHVEIFDPHGGTSAVPPPSYDFAGVHRHGLPIAVTLLKPTSGDMFQRKFCTGPDDLAVLDEEQPSRVMPVLSSVG